MLFGLAQFLWGQKYLHGHAESPAPDKLRERVLGMPREWAIYLGALAGLLPVAWLMWAVANGAFSLGGEVSLALALMILVMLVVLAWFFWFIATQCTPVQRHQMIALIALIADVPGVLHPVRADLRLLGDVHRPHADQGRRAVAGAVAAGGGMDIGPRREPRAVLAQRAVVDRLAAAGAGALSWWRRRCRTAIRIRRRRGCCSAWRRSRCWCSCCATRWCCRRPRAR